MAIDDYNPSRSLSAYFPDREERRLARLWAREKVLHDFADLGAVEFFEGPGTDPTQLSGYATNKLWLRVESGVTDEPGEIRYFKGGDPTLLASWPLLTREGFASHLGARAGAEFDYVWSSETSGDPGTGKVRGNHATLDSITELALSKTGRQGQDYGARLLTWLSGDTVRVYGVGAESDYADLRLVGAPSDQGDYVTVACTVIASSTLADGQLAGVAHYPTTLSLADEWAQKTDGPVDGADGFSAKAWAIGGTGVTGVPGRGSAHEWATAAAQSAADAATSEANALSYMNGAGVITTALPRVDRTALKALDTSQFTVAFLTESGAEGMFRWRTGDFSAEVAADIHEVVWIKADAVEATSGAWHRVYEGHISANWHGAVADGTTDSKAAFIAAAETAVALGTNVITAEPGVYRADGMTVDDISGCYLVGDGIRFANVAHTSQVCFVYPFTTQEFAHRGTVASSPGGNRGRLGIELDDATSAHWVDVFPLFKELGATFGVVWPVANGQGWIKEAYRHGFDIIAHGVSTETYGGLTPEQIHANAVTMLDAIEGVTGHRDNVAFVYPLHDRNDQSDEILRRYFTRGRGVAHPTFLPPDTGHSWLVSAFAADSHISSGNLSNRLKQWLKSLALSNGRALLYFHYASGDAQKLEALRKLIGYCRELGISIERPSNVIGKQQLIADPFFEEDLGVWWEAASGNTMTLSMSTEEAYHGEQSLKAAHHGGAETGLLRFYAHDNGMIDCPSTGLFSLFRFKVRMKRNGVVNLVNDSQSLRFFVQPYGVSLTSMARVNIDRESLGKTLSEVLEVSSSIPATDGWEVFEQIVAVPPRVSHFRAGLYMAHIQPGSAPIYFDDFTVEYLCAASSLKATATLNGTTGVTIITGIVMGEDSHVSVQATPRADVAGNISIVHSGNGRFTLKSTNADDNAEVEIVFTPTDFYALPVGGAA